MKKQWKDIEGSEVRVDVGSTREQALGDKMPAEVLCFTTDNRIVMNGEEFPDTSKIVDEVRKDTFALYIEGEVFALKADDTTERVNEVMPLSLFNKILSGIASGRGFYTDTGSVEVYVHKSLSETTLYLESPTTRIGFYKQARDEQVSLYDIKPSQVRRIEALEKTVEQLKQLLTLV